ncbi:Tubulin alpha-3C/D chain [Cichlidogyrus casuarinus]|uniref:Tubulin alpha-3C/D chain n=1 Tax=Cichlidogyrus casuarinus TaxID=1844966 RepID=A0ABD2PR43_9PLAT
MKDFKGEILNLHLGQAGAQIGHACWELNCLEHGINPCGRLYPDTNPCDENFHAFFNESLYGLYVPRAVFVDTEPTPIDEIRRGHYRNLFHPNSLVSGNEDSGCNYARGFYKKYEEMREVTAEAIRRQAESCDRLQGFIMYHSLGGGTGGGFGSSLISSLTQDYPKKAKIELGIFPSPRLQSFAVEPYNCLLASSASIDDSEVVFMIDNEAAWDNLRRSLNLKRPTFFNINRVIAQILSSVTAPMRFDGDLNGDLTAYRTNLVPYPAIHFPVISYSPLVPFGKSLHEENSAENITKAVFEPRNTLLSLDPRKGKYMAVVIMYRGDIDSVQCNTAIQKIKASKSVRFVDWCPTGFKVDINHQPVTVVPKGDLAPALRSCTALANTTAVGNALDICCQKFKKLYAKKAFVHWYVQEGMEEATFGKCAESIEGLIKDYEEAGKDSNQ